MLVRMTSFNLLPWEKKTGASSEQREVDLKTFTLMIFVWTL